MTGEIPLRPITCEFFRLRSPRRSPADLDVMPHLRQLTSERFHPILVDIGVHNVSAIPYH